ncbi:hypothetical protein Mth01_29390 [Sphaerimonospora thailandensis]|uniref:Uncharacterized protein n=1 Tax=Sphaerimonospora thailandensis TaxID=795644 RepID=A0A8J3RAC9_9ACTN|nr:hypothetical protein Mth01_29390 [Sphaerimonospora thailandensis]
MDTFRVESRDHPPNRWWEWFSSTADELGSPGTRKPVTVGEVTGSAEVWSSGRPCLP